MNASFAFCVFAVMSCPSVVCICVAFSFHGVKSCRFEMHLLPASLRIGCVGVARYNCGGCVHLLPGFPESSMVQLFLVLGLGWCWVRGTNVPCQDLGCCNGVVSGSVVLGQGRGHVAVSIVGHTVGKISPVGSSILVPESGGVAHAADRMW